MAAHTTSHAVGLLLRLMEITFGGGLAATGVSLAYQGGIVIMAALLTFKQARRRDRVGPRWKVRRSRGKTVS